jgi:hypothetical protein
MLGKFWEGLGTKLADRWAAVAVPPVLFWAGGMLAWLLAHGGFGRLEDALARASRQPGLVQAALVAGALIVVAATGLVGERLTLPALRLLEGYWPAWLAPVRRRLVARQAAKLRALEDRWSKLTAKHDEQTLSAREHDELIRLEQRLHQLPSRPERLMPTKVGNILRCAESRPVDKYGLDAVRCWPHLWLTLPDTARQELGATRAALDGAAAACVWGVASLVWSPWSPLIGLGGLTVALVAVQFWVPQRAAVFADLVESAFDLYRRNLYNALRWPLPEDPADERRQGRLLTEYLWRGLDTPDPKFSGQ